MSGKQCIGTNTVPNDPALSKAYCEGRIAAIQGWPGAVQNPHPDGTPANEVWARGMMSYNGPSGDPLPVDCCAERATDAVGP